MQLTIAPGSIKGRIKAPPSKSISQRALAAALIRQGTTTLHGIGRSEDEQAALSIIQSLGATVEHLAPDTLRITSGYPHHPHSSKNIHCGESGLALRMFTPIAALSRQCIKVSGSGSLLKRPLLCSSSLFQSLHVAFSAEGNHLPFHIQGPLQPGNIAIDGSQSSQFLTGLLFAYAAAGAADVSIRVHRLTSRPYIDLTLEVLQDFGLLIPENSGYETFYYPGAKLKAQPSAPLSYNISGDWSGAACLLVAGAIAGSVTVCGLDRDSKQADKKVLEALSDCGCRLSVSSGEVTATNALLNSFHFDATQCPDLFPPLVALAAHCSGISTIKGVSRLAVKESNRADSLTAAFGKLGTPIRIEDDRMLIEGRTMKGGEIHSHGDHRIAMACAAAALGAENPVTIASAEAVDKSYPDYYKDLQALGAAVS